MSRLPMRAHRAAAALRALWCAVGCAAALCALAPLAAWAQHSPPLAPEAAASSTVPPEQVPVPAAPAGRVPRLEIEAPGDLRDLLRRHLDLARAIGDQLAANAEKPPTAPQPGAAPPPPALGASAPLPAVPASAPARESTIEISEVEWSRLIAAAPAQARSLVQTAGYFAAQARVEREGDLVRLTLEPGPVARVDRLTIDIQGDLGDALQRRERDAVSLHGDLLDAWPLKEGEPFRQADWSAAKNGVMARLRAEGYAAASWSGTSAEVLAGDELAPGEAPRVQIFAVADSGPRFLAGGADSVVVEGTVHHEAERVRALSGLRAGMPLTETRLLDYQERLLRTGLFDQAAVSLDAEAAAAGQSVVRVQVKEAPLQNATLGVGYGTSTGPRVTGEYTHRRLFGYALTARNRVALGRDQRSFDGELSTHANEKMQRWLVGGTYELLRTDEDRVISQRVRLGRAEDLPGLERLAYTEFERSRECTYAGSACIDELTLKAGSAHVNHTWRRLDNAVLPTRGYTLSLQTGAGWAWGEAPARDPGDRPATGPYGRAYARATGYWPLPNNFFSEARLELGGVLVKNGVVVPDSQRFRAGGDDSVRGYDYRTLAPTTPDGGVTGGKLLFTASAEIARPVSRDLPSVWWAAFVDAGRAADSVGRTLDPTDPERQRTLPGIGDPALGYGVGARWRSPVGPLKLDIAYGDELKQWRLHLSVGIAF